MTTKQKDEAIKSQTESLTQAVKRLHVLTKTRKELTTLMKEKDSDVDLCITKNLNAMREAERKKRIQVYGEAEEKRQQVTSALILELMQICQQHDVPPYISAIAKVLDNYQGNANEES